MSAQARPRHAPMTQFPIVDGELMVGGRSVSALASELGTPFYAYDRAVIDTRIAALCAALPDTVKLHYAIKANPMPALVQYMAGRVDGLDVASGGELAIALASGMAPAEISFAGPGKREAELEAAVRAGVLLNVESAREVELLAGLSQRLSLPARVAVRVNPDFELKSSGMKMGGGPKAFGIDAEAVPALLARIGTLGLNFEGFHLFAGSQNLRSEAIVEAQQLSYALALRLAEHVPTPIRTLNLGGGFGIPYFPGDTPLALGAIEENLAALAERSSRELPGAGLVIELGRYLVGEAGVYVCRVIDRKISRGQVFLVCDGGLHHHLAASGNFGQLIRKNYPVLIANKAGAEVTENTTVVGPLCTPLDILAERLELAVAGPGDLVAVLQSGAYGFSASPRSFLGHPDPCEVLL
ncbi:MAG: pyridoxal-dependent decarboxylase, exosortase A system-associated [Candidatus Dactylopiibacterium carminicum]|uniref:Pyridoxal-dependent decarboxylase, exosortase A system-associated n=1 Tax=Candidatus Dactylopiibacterium carminicum TaxID=857335 RepID=A0A272ER11_9RHOO|nr:pyridoxal-dependent decarboxylase, exosortase A system-associated [Candidatus Dactylopiibacterium carminicum]KAF7598663.1 pyridoxal-dependent decarboxylase, exosortase A system-associated [Candidatus Dactylopiibacterium carminicum]PAS92553.1 MAG: pyridoxal-dependent decarboxylase, exosortase A system-associated [Candidatus Dactylopiibacterium carminicum]PAS96088.1 MAG: pyridoxal-dependent decarboxylase, exosortase A system-associated [Candidatus Dactylopiibacterium carminicum]PAS98531.1 MAG: